MGTGPSSLVVDTPPRPFERNESKSSCFVPLTKKKKNKKHRKLSVLVKLMARRDWQKALIRMSLFPHEIAAVQSMEWYCDLEFQFLPLHLACALQPPAIVISKLLEHHADTARVSMTRIRKQTVSNVGLVSGKANRHRRSFALFAGKTKSFSYFDDTTPSPTKTLATDPESPSPPSKKRGGVKRAFRKKPKRLFHNDDDDVMDHAELLQDSFLLEESLPSTQFPKRLFEDLSLEMEDMVPSVMLSLHSESSPLYSLPDGLFHENDADDKDGSVASLDKFLQVHGRCVQLNLSGGVSTMDVEEVEDSDDAPEFPVSLSLSPCLKMESALQQDIEKEQDSCTDYTLADVQGILENADDFTPLYIACLYGASPLVVKSLLDAHPLAAQVSNPSFGMLPIHVVCAGLVLPSPCTPITCQGPRNMDDMDPQEGVRSETLLELLDAFPESRVCPSLQDGLTPVAYAQRFLGAGDEKCKCLDLLHGSLASSRREPPTFAHSMDSYRGPSDENHYTLTAHHWLDEECCARSALPVPSVIVCRNSPTRSTDSCMFSRDDTAEPECRRCTQLYIHICNQDWIGCRHVLVEDPDQAREWQYGVHVDSSREDSWLWKRLPLHDACTLPTPTDIIVTLIDVHPQALGSPDCDSGALPLHTACRYTACRDETVAVLLQAHPDAAKTHDLQGCLPLHLACMTQRNLDVITKLVESHPEAAGTRDNAGMLPVDYAKTFCPMGAAADETNDIVAFLESLPAAVLSPKHKRERVNIIADAAGRSIMVGDCSKEARAHDGGQLFEKFCLSGTQEI